MEATAKKQGIYILTFVLIVLLLLGQWQRSELVTENKRLKNNELALLDTIKYQKNRLGTITASKRALVVTNRELKKQAYVKDERIVKLTKDFVSLQSVTKATQEVQIDEIPITYKDSVPCVFDKDEQVREKWYSMDVHSNQHGIDIKNVKIPNEQFIVVGEKRDGFLKPKYFTVEITNTNPNMITKDIQTQVITVPTPIYNKGWVRVLEVAGAFAFGVYLAK